MRGLSHALLGAILLCGLAPQAQAFPDRPIRLVVPYGTGGITDISARILGPQLAEELGQQIVVDNRPGGGGMIGFEIAARSQADGYTMVLATTALAANPILFKKIPYDGKKDFAPVALVGVVPLVLVVPASSPATNIAELISLARAKPGELNYGSAGNGTDNHLTAELFNHLAGLKVAHVPYRGGGQVMTDLIAGRTSFVFATLPTALPFIGEGRLRALATTGQVRSAALPQVPTVGETVLPNFALYAWLGLFAPAATPEPILKQLNAATTKALQNKDTAERLRKIGLETKGGTQQALATHLDHEMKRWSELARNVKFEKME